MIDLGERELETYFRVSRRQRVGVGLRGRSLMAMHHPPHPGEFIRESHIEPFDLSIRSFPIA